jgi:hypothetical protein
MEETGETETQTLNGLVEIEAVVQENSGRFPVNPLFVMGTMQG